MVAIWKGKGRLDCLLVWCGAAVLLLCACNDVAEGRRMKGDDSWRVQNNFGNIIGRHLRNTSDDGNITAFVMAESDKDLEDTGVGLANDTSPGEPSPLPVNDVPDEPAPIEDGNDPEAPPPDVPGDVPPSLPSPEQASPPEVNSPPPLSPPPSPPPLPPPPPENGPQATSLLSFKSSISNANSINELSSWQSGTNPCAWDGIECRNGNVQSIALADLGLEGRISPSLTDPSLSGLDLIDLSNNKLSEAIPNSFNEMNALPNLRSLDLSQNNLVGGPPRFGSNGCQKLEVFDFGNNAMTSIPDWSFKSLKSLRIEGNLLNQSVPAFFGGAVPQGGIIVIMPQSEERRVCGTLPPGPTWAQVTATGELQALQALPSCTPVPESSPPPPPPPLPQSPPIVPEPVPPLSPDVIFSPPPPPNNESSGLGIGAIIGIAVGGCFAIILIGVLLFMWCKPRKKSMSKIEDEDKFETFESGDEMDLYRGADFGMNGAIIRGGALKSQSSLNKQGSGITIGSDTSLPPNFELENSGKSGVSHSRVPSSSGLPIDVKLWTVVFKDLQMERQIGEGSFGRVYLAKWNETLVAVKILISMSSGHTSDDSHMTASNPVLVSLTKETNMMAALRHPNVVGFLGVCMDPPSIITEYCARGSLTDVLRGSKASPAKASLLDWARRLNMILDAAKGMLYLHNHSPPIIHRDLKSPNLLVDKHWRLKVSDFNLSKLLEEGAVMSSMAATNPRWLAPEILGGNNATFASDIYSFAVVMWEMMTWELPWGVTNPWQVVTMVTDGGRLSIPPRSQLPGPDNDTFEGLDAYIALMKRCWAHIPEDRPSFKEIISELREILAQTLASSSSGRVYTFMPQTSEDSKSENETSKSKIKSSETPTSRYEEPSFDEQKPQDDKMLAYASTGAMTGSIVDVTDLNASWSTKLKSQNID